MRRRERTGQRNRRRSLWQAAGVGTFRGIELDDVIVETDRLRLRPWRVEDVPRVAEVMADERMHEFLALPDPYTAHLRAYCVDRASRRERGGVRLTPPMTES